MTTQQRPTVLITGSSGGIGAALVREFHSKGYTVFATARRPDALQEISQLENVHPLALDVCDEESIRRARDSISEITGGKLDILFNNAGMNGLHPAAEPDMTAVRKIFETNLFGVMATVKHFAPLVIAAKGKIINVASIAALASAYFGSTYAASKLALFAYSDALRLELAPFGVGVSAIAAGGVATAMLDNQVIEISSDSIYAPIASNIDVYVRSRLKVPVVSADSFARAVVKQTLSTSPSRWIWAGTGAYILWWARFFLPQSVIDWFANNAVARLDWNPLKTSRKYD